MDGVATMYVKRDLQKRPMKEVNKFAIDSIWSQHMCYSLHRSLLRYTRRFRRSLLTYVKRDLQKRPMKEVSTFAIDSIWSQSTYMHYLLLPACGVGIRVSMCYWHIVNSTFAMNSTKETPHLVCILQKRPQICYIFYKRDPKFAMYSAKETPNLLCILQKRPQIWYCLHTESEHVCTMWSMY